MAYVVKKVGRCAYCKAKTYRKAPNPPRYMCLDCGVTRMVANITGRTDVNSDVTRAADMRMIEWAANGGIERADQPYKWKRAMREQVQFLREKWGIPPPDASPAEAS